MKPSDDIFMFNKLLYTVMAIAVITVLIVYA